jgi:hypothetical protein
MSKDDSWLHKPDAATKSLALDLPPELASELAAEAAQLRLPLSECAVRPRVEMVTFWPMQLTATMPQKNLNAGPPRCES